MKKTTEFIEELDSPAPVLNVHVPDYKDEAQINFDPLAVPNLEEPKRKVDRSIKVFFPEKFEVVDYADGRAFFAKNANEVIALLDDANAAIKSKARDEKSIKQLIVNLDEKVKSARFKSGDLETIYKQAPKSSERSLEDETLCDAMEIGFLLIQAMESANKVSAVVQREMTREFPNEIKSRGAKLSADVGAVKTESYKYRFCDEEDDKGNFIYNLYTSMNLFFAAFSVKMAGLSLDPVDFYKLRSEVPEVSKFINNGSLNNYCDQYFEGLRNLVRDYKGQIFSGDEPEEVVVDSPAAAAAGAVALDLLSINQKAVKGAHRLS